MQIGDDNDDDDSRDDDHNDVYQSYDVCGNDHDDVIQSPVIAKAGRLEHRNKNNS